MRYLGVSEIRTEFKRYANIYDARIKSGKYFYRKGKKKKEKEKERKKKIYKRIYREVLRVYVKSL